MKMNNKGLFAKSRCLEDEMRQNIGGIGYEF